jgi:hypothetical protein
LGSVFAFELRIIPPKISLPRVDRNVDQHLVDLGKEFRLSKVDLLHRRDASSFHISREIEIGDHFLSIGERDLVVILFAVRISTVPLMHLQGASGYP